MMDQVERDLVQLCGTSQCVTPSAAYLHAMKKIAAMDTRLQQGGPGKEIEVPVRVFVGRSSATLNYDNLGKAMTMIEGAERVIKQQWRRYKHVPVAAGTIRSTVVLEPMTVDFSRFSRATTVSVANTIENMMAGNVWFSEVALTLKNVQHTSASTLALGQLLMTLFDKRRRYPELANTKLRRDQWDEVQGTAPLQLGSMRLLFDQSLRSLDGDSIFSAMLMNQTTKKLSISLRMDRSNASENKRWWKWMAYAFFTKRAQGLSALESLSLCNISSMSAAEMAAFAAVVTSDHPEEKLFGCLHSSVDEKDATVKSGSLVYQIDFSRRQQTSRPPALRLTSSIPFVRIFGDDGQSILVNAIIPGFGRCQVKRADREFGEGIEIKLRPRFVTSLYVQFNVLVQANGLPQLLETVGFSLKTLSIDGYLGNLDLNMILSCCRKLRELSVRRRILDAKLNFIKYCGSAQSIVFPSISWNNISELADNLIDMSNPLAQCIRRLRVRLTNIEKWMQHHPALDAYVEDLLRMLDTNKNLEYLEVTVPSNCHRYQARFKSHHKTPIQRDSHLSTDTKVAFLSVQGSSKGSKQARAHSQKTLVPALDQDVLAKIFEYAGRHVCRQVYFREKVSRDTFSGDEADSSEDD
ncbi:hypothetical protein ON010_g17790 [Phytophthora cinnamomi]|nr:hypothetical protein ON010_g17790 [Phytophthora cinnamomi]